MPSMMAAHWVCVQPPSKCYWLVNTSPLNYGWWVGQNSGLIFCRLCTNVHRIKFASVGVSAVCNAIFWLTISCRVLETFVIKSQSCAKSCWNWTSLGHQVSGVGAPNIWPNFINLSHHWPCGKVWWRSAKQPRRLGGKKRKEERKKT